MTNTQKILIALAASLGCVVACAFYYTKEPMENNENGGDAQDNTASGTPSQRNFKISEYQSHDGVDVPPELYGNVQKNMDNLQVLRDAIGLPILIVSGYRSPAHNAAVGGATNSFHMRGMASDIKVPGMSPKSVRAKIEDLIAQGKMSQGGLGAYDTFTHYDVRGYEARWNG